MRHLLRKLGATCPDLHSEVRKSFPFLVRMSDEGRSQQMSRFLQEFYACDQTEVLQDQSDCTTVKGSLCEKGKEDTIELRFRIVEDPKYGQVAVFEITEEDDLGFRIRQYSLSVQMPLDEPIESYFRHVHTHPH